MAQFCDGSLALLQKVRVHGDFDSQFLYLILSACPAQSCRQDRFDSRGSSKIANAYSTSQGSYLEPFLVHYYYYRFLRLYSLPTSHTWL